MAPVTKEPCIDICEFNKKAICKAWGAPGRKKKQWKQLSADERQAIWIRVLDFHGSGKGKRPLGCFFII